jgi:hypothetical protein
VLIDQQHCFETIDIEIEEELYKSEERMAMQTLQSEPRCHAAEKRFGSQSAAEHSLGVRGISSSSDRK